MAETFIGVDVSKRWIDVYRPGLGFSRIDMERKQLRGFVRQLDPQGDLVVLEATGGYETMLLEELERRAVRYHRANPARARNFARAIGVIGKTDRVDAGCLSRMGQQLQLPATPPLSAAQSALKKLAARRRQLVEMRKQEKTRALQATDRIICRSIASLITVLTKQIKAIEARMLALQEKEGLGDRAVLIQSVPGVGPVVCATILAELPELGQTDRRAIAALAGLAPIARDSGQRNGHRSIGKGRAVLRSALYIAALHASRHNPAFKAFRHRLQDKGKAPKQAIIAVARKLLTILNAMIKSGKPYQANRQLI